MKKFLILFITLISLNYSFAQDSITVIRNDRRVDSMNSIRSNSVTTIEQESPRHPYKTSFKKDAPIIAAGIGLTYLGNTLIKNKDPLTLAELATRTKDKVPFFDRGNVGFFSENVDRDSYIPFLGSFAMPLAMIVLNKNESRNASHILVMYIESLSITSSLFTLAAGTIHRSRPLVYAPSEASQEERIKAKNQRSFFAGHTAATASATFFAAKVFHDLNPDSKAKPFVWAVAATLPAIVGYMRYKGGLHFLSDNLLGYAIGAASGILIPEWHKNKNNNDLSISPFIGKKFKGMSLVYNIK